MPLAAPCQAAPAPPRARVIGLALVVKSVIMKLLVLIIFMRMTIDYLIQDWVNGYL